MLIRGGGGVVIFRVVELEKIILTILTKRHDDKRELRKSLNFHPFEGALENFDATTNIEQQDTFHDHELSKIGSIPSKCKSIGGLFTL